MTHRNRLLAFGACAALVAGSTFLAAPAVAAPNSAACISAQTALGFSLDSASVDIGLAYDLKAAIAAVEAAGVALEEAYLNADVAETEVYAAYESAFEAFEAAIVAVDLTQAALDAAQTAKIFADDRVEAAELALAAVGADDAAGRLAAEAELTAARAVQTEATSELATRQVERDAAPASLVAAEAVLMEAQTALDNALYTDDLIAAEDAYYAAVDVIEGILSDLDGPGTSPEEVQALVNAALAACAATGNGTGQGIEVPVIAITPGPPSNPGVVAAGTSTGTGRGLNVQTAASDSGERGSVLELTGAAGAALLLLSGVALWFRRSTRA
ncbi:hypothetical protein [Arthrobacter sp. H20]|uniref:hypothetical protein n=1 Tax=Arthrobacter sp. H20 TaxID=1267981 RepID=UPI00047CBED0|nr:hypothetical protein [Arthrobacter sp. H20]